MNPIAPAAAKTSSICDLAIQRWCGCSFWAGVLKLYRNFTGNNASLLFHSRRGFGIAICGEGQSFGLQDGILGITRTIAPTCVEYTYIYII